MGTDPGAPDNVWLRGAAQRQIPVIYFLGVSPGCYQAIMPTFVVDLGRPRLDAAPAGTQARSGPARGRGTWRGSGRGDPHPAPRPHCRRPLRPSTSRTPASRPHRASSVALSSSSSSRGSAASRCRTSSGPISCSSITNSATSPTKPTGPTACCPACSRSRRIGGYCRRQARSPSPGSSRRGSVRSTQRALPDLRGVWPPLVDAR